AVGQTASVVLIGTLKGLENGAEAGYFTLTLSVAKTLKGLVYTSVVVAGLAPGDSYVTPSVLPNSLVGQTGIWFLSESGSGYQVIPTETGRILPNDVFLPVSDSLAAAGLSGTTEYQLLQYLVGWYRSLSNPTVRDDMKCLTSLQSQSTSPEASLAAANSLIGSPAVASQIIGLAAAIGLGSDSAVAALSTSLHVVSKNPKFYLITGALATSYQPHGVGSISVLKQIIDQHSAVPGIDAAVGAALSKIVVKQTLPVMAELLNSSDPTAQLRAASFFGLFTLFADSNGNVSGGGPEGPLASDETRLYTPRRDSGVSPQQYSQFWRGWWAEHHTLLGL
ncbi:MAG TPA: hypothetical protein DEQ47_04615, partial [Solibacterales bacterium]|nr:hypothetical protein [Bryobacterales bacterium]